MIGPARASNPDSPITVARRRVLRRYRQRNRGRLCLAALVRKIEDLNRINTATKQHSIQQTGFILIVVLHVRNAGVSRRTLVVFSRSRVLSILGNGQQALCKQYFRRALYVFASLLNESQCLCQD